MDTYFSYNYYNTLVTAEFNFELRFPRGKKISYIIKIQRVNHSTDEHVLY